MRVAAITALLAVGCLSVPPEEAPMCESSSDCDQGNGEICAEGVCWGDPPDGVYAARIGPPSNLTGVAPTEITSVEIADNGWFTTNLRLERPVVLSGTVVHDCAEAPCPAIAATITVTRPSRIVGGPAFVATTHTTEESSAFSIEVPRAEPGEDYSVVVTPDRAAAVAIPLDDVAPIRRIINPTDHVADFDLRLGAPGRVVRGVVVDYGGQPLEGATVVVRGRWDETTSTVTLSSLGAVDADGAFAINLPDNTFDPDAKLVVVPPDDAYMFRPTLSMLLDLSVAGEVVEVAPIEVPYLGATQTISLPITGTTAMGVVEPVVDAEVRLVASAVIPRPPGDPITAVYEVEETTGPDGRAQMAVVASPLLTYELHVKPPAAGGAGFATIYGTPFEIADGTAQPVIHLVNQVAVRGRLFTADGHPAAGVVVTAIPNAYYAATLSEELQQRLDEVVSTSETTNANGEFAVFIDPEIDEGFTPQYDVMFEAPQASLVPNWQLQALNIDRTDGFDMGDVFLPEAAYVRATVTDPDELLLAGAEVRLYEIPTEILPCGEVFGPAEDDPVCAQKAILRSLGVSDERGEVHLVLPDP